MRETESASTPVEDWLPYIVIAVVAAAILTIAAPIKEGDKESLENVKALIVIIVLCIYGFGAYGVYGGYEAASRFGFELYGVSVPNIGLTSADIEVKLGFYNQTGHDAPSSELSTTFTLLIILTSSI